MNKKNKKALIIGATSGIGKALARELVKNGYTVGITGRRKNLLLKIQKESPELIQIESFDSTQPNALKHIESLANKMGAVNLFIISAGVGHMNFNLEYAKENETNQLNVIAFSQMVNWGIHYFENQGHGHLVNLSSIASLRGGRAAPAYNASKAYQSNYFEGIAQRVTRSKLPIFTTDVKPGFVKTSMAKGPKMFWVASKEKAARQIFKSIQKKKRIVYITKRWRIIAWILKRIPWLFYKRM